LVEEDKSRKSSEKKKLGIGTKKKGSLRGVWEIPSEGRRKATSLNGEYRIASINI